MMNMIALYEDFLLNTKKSSANTVASYMRDIRQFDTYLASHLNETVDAVSKDQAEVYFAWLTNSGKSAATVSRPAWC